MTKPFKFRYVREIVGTFMLLVMLVLVAGVVLAGRAQGWFEPKMELHVRFPEEGLAGIQKGAKVQTLGTEVGTVHKVLVNDDESMEAVLRIKGPFIRFIRSDSQAIIKKTYGVAGDAFIEITRGHGPALTSDFLSAPARKDREIVELVEELVEQVQWAAIPMMDQVTTAVEQYADLAIDLQHSVRELQSLMQNLDAVAAGLQAGEGTAGRLLKDPETVESLNAVVASLHDLLGEVNTVVLHLQSTSTNIQGVVQDAHATVRNIKRASTGLPAMMNQTEDTLIDIESVLEGVQKHWLLRKYVPPMPSIPERIPATMVHPADDTPQAGTTHDKEIIDGFRTDQH